MLRDPRLDAEIDAHPFPLLFVTVSGAHLYGFASPDSDVDLRAAHILPLPEFLRLEPGPETVERTVVRDGLEIDLVSHDLTKYFGMVLQRNGYVLEQIFSPLVMRTSPGHAELRDIAARCVTRRHAHHYLGFARTQWGLFVKERPRRVKPLLYVYRVLLTGITLMRTGAVECDVNRLNGEFGLTYLADLVARKRSGPEQATLDDADTAFHEGEVGRLVALLEHERDASRLPDAPAARRELDDLLVRLRLSGR